MTTDSDDTCTSWDGQWRGGGLESLRVLQKVTAERDDARRALEIWGAVRWHWNLALGLNPESFTDAIDLRRMTEEIRERAGELAAPLAVERCRDALGRHFPSYERGSDLEKVLQAIASLTSTAKQHRRKQAEDAESHRLLARLIETLALQSAPEPLASRLGALLQVCTDVAAKHCERFGFDPKTGKKRP